jgi:hypothetical protein
LRRSSSFTYAHYHCPIFRSCPTAASRSPPQHLPHAARSITRYFGTHNSPRGPTTSAEEPERGPIFPSLNDGTRKPIFVAAAVIIVGAILGLVFSPRRQRVSVPENVAALCHEAAELRESAPLNAAHKYAAALAQARATSASPVVSFEILVLLADCETEARQAARARAHYAEALALVERLRRSGAVGAMSDVEAAAVDLPRKHAAVLTRLADLLAEDAGSPAGDGDTTEAVRLSHAALAVLNAEYSALAARALRGHFSCGAGASGSGMRSTSGLTSSCRHERQLLVDYAGVHSNLARLLPGTQAAAGAGSTAAAAVESVAAAQGHALRSAILVSAARLACCRELIAATDGGGIHVISASDGSRSAAGHAGAGATRRRLVDELGLSNGSEAEDGAADLLSQPPDRTMAQLAALRAAYPLPARMPPASRGTARDMFDELLLLEGLSAEAVRLWEALQPKAAASELQTPQVPLAEVALVAS